MADYKEFLDSINREAYHAGEYQWEEDGYTVTRTYHYSPPGCHSSCGLLYLSLIHISSAWVRSTW